MEWLKTTVLVMLASYTDLQPDFNNGRELLHCA